MDQRPEVKHNHTTPAPSNTQVELRQFGGIRVGGRVGWGGLTLGQDVTLNLILKKIDFTKLIHTTENTYTIRPTPSDLQRPAKTSIWRRKCHPNQIIELFFQPNRLWYYCTTGTSVTTHTVTELFSLLLPIFWRVLLISSILPTVFRKNNNYFFYWSQVPTVEHKPFIDNHGGKILLLQNI